MQQSCLKLINYKDRLVSSLSEEFCTTQILLHRPNAHICNMSNYIGKIHRRRMQTAYTVRPQLHSFTMMNMKIKHFEPMLAVRVCGTVAAIILKCSRARQKSQRIFSECTAATSLPNGNPVPATKTQQYDKIDSNLQSVCLSVLLLIRCS